MKYSLLALMALVVMGCGAICCAGESSKARKDPRFAKVIEKLTPLQRRVTQHEGTEPPFRNEFWNNKKAGIYVDIVSGEAKLLG